MASRPSARGQLSEKVAQRLENVELMVKVPGRINGLQATLTLPSVRVTWRERKFSSYLLSTTLTKQQLRACEADGVIRVSRS